MERQFNLAIVGLGGMGNWHRQTIETIDNLTVCGSFDIDPARQDFAREHGITPYNSFEELLADEKVDIVLCATPNDVHYEIVTRALKAGKNVVCEKPVAMSSDEFAKMIEVSKEAGKLLVVHQNRRWDGDFQTIKKIYDEQLLDKVFKIESRVHGSRGIPGDWRKEPEHGGGMILDWGVHIIDQALQMIDSKVKSVYATFTNITNELVEDGFTVELTFENGIVYVVEVGTSNFISLPRWYILGRDGSAVINNFKVEGKVRKEGKITRIIDWDKNDAVPIRTAAGLTKTMAPRTPETIKDEDLPLVKTDIRDYYKNVMATIEGKAEIIVKNEEVMRCLKLMEKCFESAKAHQVLPFE